MLMTAKKINNATPIKLKMSPGGFMAGLPIQKALMTRASPKPVNANPQSNTLSEPTDYEFAANQSVNYPLHP